MFEYMMSQFNTGDTTDTMNAMAQTGWRVHTIHFHTDNRTIIVLFEREVLVEQPEQKQSEPMAFR